MRINRWIATLPAAPRNDVMIVPAIPRNDSKHRHCEPKAKQSICIKKCYNQ